MMTSFDAAARTTDPETSKAAAQSIPPGVLEAEIMAVFHARYSRTLDGLTDDQLCWWLSEHHPPTVKTARSRLTKAGRLVNSGRTAPSNRGRASILWRLP